MSDYDNNIGGVARGHIIVPSRTVVPWKEHSQSKALQFQVCL
jgi:hypothetical protein